MIIKVLYKFSFFKLICPTNTKLGSVFSPFNEYNVIFITETISPNLSVKVDS